MKITWATTTANDYDNLNTLSGGNIYDKMSFETLKKYYNLELLHIKRPKPRTLIKNIYKTYLFYKSLRNINYSGRILILDNISLAFVNKKPGIKTIAVLHHIDNNILLSWKNLYLKRKFYDNLRNTDIIITVSQYWLKEFRDLGCRDVRVIYNPFDVSRFVIKEEKVFEFKTRYNIPLNKPLIYLGNCREEKGVMESYEQLKDIDACLITSGTKNIHLPVINLHLNYDDYLLLLKSSTIVLTMSKMTEGWCRTAHEAMLCGTPVIGSGTGGMKELLQDGKQIICEKFDDLQSIVTKLLNNKEMRNKMGLDGRELASSFSLEKFENDWKDVINTLAKKYDC